VLKFIPFPTTYLCEAGFTRYAATESIYRYRLDVAHDMRIHLSTIPPKLKDFVRRITLFFTLVAYEVRLNVYSNSGSLLFSIFLCQPEKGRL
jgi:hypothetical protein